MIYQT